MNRKLFLLPFLALLPLIFLLLVPAPATTAGPQRMPGWHLSTRPVLGASSC